jgi:hypothetical protein
VAVVALPHARIPAKDDTGGQKALPYAKLLANAEKIFKMGQ